MLTVSAAELRAEWGRRERTLARDWGDGLSSNEEERNRVFSCMFSCLHQTPRSWNHPTPSGLLVLPIAIPYNLTVLCVSCCIFCPSYTQRPGCQTPPNTLSPVHEMSACIIKTRRIKGKGGGGVHTPCLRTPLPSAHTPPSKF